MTDNTSTRTNHIIQPEVTGIDNTFSVADFFCGAGGFSEGFYQAGFELKFCLDYWHPAIKTHLLNHPKCEAKCMDIRLLDTPEKIDEIVPDTDVIIGSPPCVSFSNSNKSGNADKTLGIELIYAFLRIVSYKKHKKGSKLKYWIMENVPNSKKFVKEKYSWNELGLPGNGPDLEIPIGHVLKASDYLSPQDRKRFICGNYILPKKQPCKLHINHIMQIIGAPHENKKGPFEDPIYGHKVNEINEHYYNSKIAEYEWVKAKRLKTDHGYMGKMSFPDTINRFCRTIMATQSCSTREAIIFPKEDEKGSYRSATIRELSSCMGFPLEYQWWGNNLSTKHRQIGNAVCPPLAMCLGKELIKALSKRERTNPIPRNIVKAPFTLEQKPYVNKIEKPKKKNAKFHRHVPYQKIRSFRTELDNTNSDWANENYSWNVTIHKGSGKNARKLNLSKQEIEKIFKKNANFETFKKKVKDEFSKTNVNNTKTFQYKYCKLDNSNHMSPEDVLEKIKVILDSYDLDNEVIEINSLKVPHSILLSNWALHFVIGLLN